MNAKRVLIITYYFPPRSHIASLRLRGLAKYLAEFGWEPVILTASLASTPDPRFRVIQTLYPGDATALLKRKLHLSPNKGFQEQIGIPLAVREGKRSFTSKAMTFAKGIIAYPDEQKAWLPFAVKAGNELLSRERFDAVLSSSGPFTAHMIANRLKKEHDIPWLADLRDPWTQGHNYPYCRIRKWFEKRLEVETLALADALTIVSDPAASRLSDLHKGKHVFVITNGFDPDEVTERTLTEQFTITYTGQIYRGHQDPALLFEALAELLSEEVIERKNLMVRLFGPERYWLEKEVRRYSLEQEVKQYGVIRREEALERQRESQVLLLLKWGDESEKGVYSGKLFEYLAARRPILALGGSEDVVSRLLEETNAGVQSSDVQSLKEAIRSWYKEYELKGHVAYKGRDDQIAKYSHREMAWKFAKVLNGMVES